MVWYEKFNWKENPFTIDPIPDALVINDIRDQVREYIESEMIVNLYGETGSGKSTILNWFKENLKGKYHPAYIDFSTIVDYAPEGTDKEDRQYYGFLNRLEIEVFSSPLDSIMRIFSKKPLIKRLESKFRNRTLVLLLDEANEVRDERISSYLRSLNDSMKCSSVIASVKPLTTIETFKESFRTGRVTDFIKIRKPTDEEAILMVRERIERAGGKGIEPFSEGVLRRIISLANHSPREILEICSLVLMQAANRGDAITEQLVDKVVAERNPVVRSSSEGAASSRYNDNTKIIHPSSEGAAVPRVRLASGPGGSALEEIEGIGKEAGVERKVGIERGVGIERKLATERAAEPEGKEAISDVNKIFENLTQNQQRIILSLKNGAKTSEILVSELNISRGALFTEIYRLMLKRDITRMRKKGLTKPAILKTEDVPAKFSLSSEWRLGLVKE